MDCEHWTGLQVHSSYSYLNHFTMRAVLPSLIDFAKISYFIDQVLILSVLTVTLSVE